MSVSMPLQQAASPIHLDLILVCRKAQNKTVNGRKNYSHHPAIDKAKEQALNLKSAGIKMSLGDAKVILMGCFLCEAHKMGNIEQEERLFTELEQRLDDYVNQVMSAKGKVRYKVKEQAQLLLFEEIEKYLTNKEGRQV